MVTFSGKRRQITKKKNVRLEIKIFFDDITIYTSKGVCVSFEDTYVSSNSN